MEIFLNLKITHTIQITCNFSFQKYKNMPKMKLIQKTIQKNKSLPLRYLFLIIVVPITVIFYSFSIKGISLDNEVWKRKSKGNH